MPKKLTEEQISSYRERGFICPVDVFSREQASNYLDMLETFESENRQFGRGFNFKPHLLFPWVNEIGRHPAVLDIVEDLIGPDIRLFNLAVWPKNPHDPAFVSWHQDGTYYGLEPSTQVTVWVALSDATVEAGCMEIVPGSHKLGQLHHAEIPSDSSLLSRGQTIDDPFDTDNTIFMPVSAGQCSVHDTFTIHSSGPNNADFRRVGLGFFYIPTSSRCSSSMRLSAMLVRGEDRYGYYDDEPSPVETFGEAEQAFHKDAVARFVASQAEQALKY